MDFIHLINRGVEKRAVYLEEKDYIRFLHDMYTFNDTVPADPNHRFKKTARRRNQLVVLHAFCLMPNHYHLLVSEVVEGGISLFMRKLNMGYAKYFNEKYKRVGVLWQGTFKKVSIVRDAHFMYIPYYIHLNPLDVNMPEWREGRVRDTRRALAYLRTYRWSSFLDYFGINTMPSLINKKYIGLGSPKEQEREIRRIISSPNLASGADLLE